MKRPLLPALALAAFAVAAAHAQQPPSCGLQRAAVVEGRDPEGKDRLLISMPALGPEPVWAARVYAKKPFRAAGAATGDLVLVLFEDCDPAHPVVIGFVRP